MMNGQHFDVEVLDHYQSDCWRFSFADYDKPQTVKYDYILPTSRFSQIALYLHSSIDFQANKSDWAVALLPLFKLASSDPASDGAATPKFQLHFPTPAELVHQ
eukprot:TRINITY_DN14198_c0_g4_i1.p1 TRINITY_DN14198_c0_g4~~TRINITY_DN14198_c0_g4_i1.p1  ORF type:complete len:103 (-),score=30.08 TRINITY_DN14198_c0_g4_i1:14-322(-)